MKTKGRCKNLILEKQAKVFNITAYPTIKSIYILENSLILTCIYKQINLTPGIFCLRHKKNSAMLISCVYIRKIVTADISTILDETQKISEKQIDSKYKEAEMRTAFAKDVISTNFV